MCSVDYNFSYKLSFRHNICCFYLTWAYVTCLCSSIRFLLPTKPFCCTKLVCGWFCIAMKFSQMNDVLDGYFGLIFYCSCAEIVVTVLLVLKLNPKLSSSCQFYVEPIFLPICSRLRQFLLCMHRNGHKCTSNYKFYPKLYIIFMDAIMKLSTHTLNQGLTDTSHLLSLL